MEDNNQTVTINLNKSRTAVIIALFIICCIIGGYLIMYALKPTGYHEMYLLDNQNQAVSYSHSVVINQNSTFNTPIVVTNNMFTQQYYQIQVKIVHHTINFPVDASPYGVYEFTLDAKEQWSNQIPITINEEGTYSIVFELYTKNDADYVFTNNYCILHVTAFA